MQSSPQQPRFLVFCRPLTCDGVAARRDAMVAPPVRRRPYSRVLSWHQPSASLCGNNCVARSPRQQHTRRRSIMTLLNRTTSRGLLGDHAVRRRSVDFAPFAFIAAFPHGLRLLHKGLAPSRGGRRRTTANRRRTVGRSHGCFAE